MVEITGKNYIGNCLRASGNKVFWTFNPLTNTTNSEEYLEATADEITEAVELAWKAFKIYRKFPDERRAEFLECIAEEILALGDDLINQYMLESGLPKGRAEGERGRTIFQLNSFAEMLRKGTWMDVSVDSAQPERTPIPKEDIRKMYVPLGPVVVFGASNFPLAYSTAGGDTASALAAGCPVIVKSHPMHAGTGELVASAIVKAAEKTSMPQGIFSNLNSSGIEVGKQLVLEPKVKAVGFTGSINGGRALYDLANSRPEPIPVFAEMGSINPVVISQKTLVHQRDHWANKYADSITVGTGQFCTNPGLLLAVASRELDFFCTDLAEKIALKTPSVMLHPDIERAFEFRKNDLIEGSSAEKLTPSIATEANYGEQSVAIATGAEFITNPKLRQEVFGPFSLVVKCKDQAELLAVIENLEGQLTGTILAQEDEYTEMTELIEELQQRVGRIIFNGVPTGVEVCRSMNHGGPYPASTDSRFTAVGLDSIKRWIRPIAYQNFPKQLLPKLLQNG